MRRFAVLGVSGASIVAAFLVIVSAFAGSAPAAASRSSAPVSFAVHDASWASLNWAGYAVTGSAGSVSDVKGSWTVPTATCTGATAYAAFWLGIDGFNSNTVEQTGTDSDCQAGVATYYAWYEFFPKFPVQLSLAIHPGDTINAEVLYVGSGAFQVSLADATTGQSFATIQKLHRAQRSSAEWIAEAPSSSGGVLPLANFGSVTFTNGQATVGGVTAAIGAFASAVQVITMVTGSGAVKAQPSGLDTTGSSFSVTWVSSGP